MIERETHIEQFLTQHLGADYSRSTLAADASARRYERIIHDGKPYVLMDAPPPTEDVRPFCVMTHWLRDAGLHAPHILGEDAQNGLLLLEDFGDASYRKHIQRTPQDEWPLYKVALDALVAVQQAAPLPAINAYDEAAYLRELNVFTDWYLPTIGKEEAASSFLALWQSLLANAGLKQHCVVLRDYHADNLMWMPKLEGTQRAGLLDYQDALIGDAAYDLVSLLEDARRDVTQETCEQALAYYLAQSGEDKADFMARYALLGAQRNLKIIGIFHRLNTRDGKPNYLPLLPRVWAHLKNDVAHPALAQINDWLTQHCASHMI